MITGLRTSGSRATDIIQIPNEEILNKWMEHRLKVRNMSMDEFIENYGSGTLRKNKRIGMNVSSHSLSERAHYEFGAYFECLPERFITWGEARSEPDCSPITEVGWYTERYANLCLFPGDEIEVKYITVEAPGEIKREGIGLIVRKTSAHWVSKGFTVFAFITIYNPTIHDFEEARNIC